MSYNVTSQAATVVENMGSQHSLEILTGAVALSSGSITVTIPGAKGIVSVVVGSQSSNASYVSASSASGFTITGTGSDVVMWIACVKK